MFVQNAGKQNMRLEVSFVQRIAAYTAVLLCAITSLLVVSSRASAQNVYPPTYSQRGIDGTTNNPLGGNLVASASNFPSAANINSYQYSPVGMPISWPSWGQLFGFSPFNLPANFQSYGQANNSTASYPYGGAYSTDYLAMLSAAPIPPFPWQSTGVDPGTQLRGYLLGDYYDQNTANTVPGTNEPPTGPNHFLDDSGGATLDATKIASWVTPFFAISNISTGQLAIPNTTVDDTGSEPTGDPTPIIADVFTPGGFIAAIASTTTTGAVNGTYVESPSTTGAAGATASWTIVSPVAGEISVWANIPVNPAENPAVSPPLPAAPITNPIQRVPDAEYTVQDSTAGLPATPIAATIDQTRGGWVLISAVNVVTAGDTITVTLTNVSGTAGETVVADAVQLRDDATQILDNTDPPTVGGAPFQTTAGWTVANTPDIDIFGTDYLTAAPVARSSGSTATATWTFTALSNSPYDLDVEYPSQVLGDVHAKDAEYTVNILDKTTGLSVYTAQNLISQVIGGEFVRAFGPLLIPAGDQVTLTLDNTTAAPIVSNEVIVADAAELLPDNGEVAGQPLAVNVSDYPELQYGQGGGTNGLTGPAPGNDASGNLMPGGLPLQYKTTPLNFGTGVTGFTTSGTTNPYAYYGVYNNVLGQLPTGAAATSTLLPIEQATFFGRTENTAYSLADSAGSSNSSVQTAGAATQSGAMYCTDGLNGNVIWKFGAASDVIDNSDAINFAANASPWGTPQTGLDTNFYGNDYLTTECSTSNSAQPATTLVPAAGAPGGAGEDAYWHLPLVGGADSAASYFVYAWVPTPQSVATNVPITDAQYTVNTFVAGSASPVQVNVTADQTQGNQWVKLVNPSNTNGSFLLGANNNVQLSNVESATNPASASPQPFVVADAMLFVPVGSGTGSIYSTPVLVRQMRVDEWAPGLYNAAAPIAGTPQTRDCLVFSDDLGKVYCVDAGGNGDGDDTILDQAGNTVSFNASGAPFNAGTGTYYVQPYNFHIRHYGTTQVYWIWQPSALASAIQAIAPSPGDTVGKAVGVSDPTRDLPVPSAFKLNSPTVSLTPVTQTANSSSYGYNATIFIGNSNSVLYSIDASNGAEGAAPPVWRSSVDPTTPMPGVNWWFQAPGSIAYAPAFDGKDPTTGNAADKDGLVLVTTYDPNFDNIGHLFAIDALHGPVGNDGKGATNAAGPHYPGSPSYNNVPIPYWSFPDAYGTVSSLTASPQYHFQTSATAAPAWPLGDMAGAPTVESIQNDSGTHVLVVANDPNVPGGTQEPATYGRVYSVNASNGAFEWAFPATGTSAANPSGDPNRVTNSNAAVYDSTYQLGLADYPFNSSAPVDRNTAFSTILPAFTGTNSGIQGSAFDGPAVTTGVSSSVSTALITFPTDANLPASEQGIYGNVKTPVAYVGSLGGNMLAINLNAPKAATLGQSSELIQDTDRLVYNEPITLSPIFSTAAVLAGSASSEGSTDTNAEAEGNAEVGGVLFFTTADHQLIELEAAPYSVTIGSGASATPTEIVNEDWAYTAPGDISSPSIASFDVTPYKAGSPFYNVNATAVNPLPANVNANPLGTSEWVMCGSDDGFTYAFSPNNSSGGGFTSSIFIAGGSQAPPNGQVNLYSQLITALSADGLGANYTNYDPGGNTIVPPANPVFDYGQKIYVQIFGINDPNGNDPPEEITFSLSQVGTGAGPAQTVTIGNPSPTGVAQVKAYVAAIGGGTFPPAGYAADQFPSPSFVFTYGLPLVQGAPGTKYAVENAQELLADGTTIGGSLATARVIRHNGSRVPLTSGQSPVTLTLLNPLAVSGAGPTLLGGLSNALTYHELGPYSGVPALGTGNFSTWQPAGGNGDKVPQQDPPGGIPLNAPGVPPADIYGDPVSEPVLTSPGYVSHGSGGDNGTGIQQDPADHVYPASIHGDSTAILASSNGTGYGSSMLLLADRSAMGAHGSSLGSIYEHQPITGLSWNSNGAGQGPEAVINPLSWETLPTSGSFITNTSRDYPNIAASALNISLESRSASPGGTTTYPLGVGGIIPAYNPQSTANTNGNNLAQLAPSDPGNGDGDPGGTRRVFPNNVLVKVAVPRFQPANLETIQPPPATAVSTPSLGTPVTHTALASPTDDADMPDGYVSTVDLYVSPGGNATPFSDNVPYRAVNVTIDVPVDMSMAVQQPLIDLGNVTPGFGNQAVDNNGAIPFPIVPFTPFLYNGGVVPLPSITNMIAQKLFSTSFQPITLVNNGNTNLWNVHFAQQFAGPGVVNTGYVSFMSLLSNQNEKVAGLFDPTNNSGQIDVNPANWTDSLSFIPGIDPNGLLTNWVANNTAATQLGFSPNIVRTSIDSDIYAYNPNEARVVSNTKNLVTFHKQLVGSTQGTILTIPDNPTSSSNPAYYTSATNPIVGVGVAIPMGTPVGDYTGILRAFEGSDPYPTANTPGWKSDGIQPLNSGLSGIYSGPQYDNVTQTGGAGLTTYDDNNALALDSNGNPMQYYTAPGTTLKLRVVESQITDDPPITAQGSIASTVVNLALPNIDYAPVPAQIYQSSASIPSIYADDVQPFAFRKSFSSPLGSDGYPFGMFYVSDKTPSAAGGTSRIPGTTDLWATSLGGVAASGSGLTALSVPSGANAQSWWTATQNVTSSFSGAPTSFFGWAGSVHSPYVLTNYEAANSQVATALWVATSVPPLPGATNLSNTPATSYTICSDNITGVTSAGMTLAVPVSSTQATSPGGVPAGISLFQTSDPVYGLSAFRFKDTPTQALHSVVIWHTRKGGRSSIEYIVDPQVGGASVAQTLPVSTGLVNSTNPVPVLRTISTLAGGSFSPDPDSNLASNPQAVLDTSSPDNANCVDITYSGTSQDGSTDIYTSRYQLTTASTNNSGLTWSFTRVPVVPQQPASPATLLPQTLVQSPADKSLYVTRDVDWYADPNYFTVTESDPANVGPNTLIGLPIANKTLNYTFDKSSGVATYTGLDLSKIGGSATNGIAFVNFSEGTVKFNVVPTAGVGVQLVITASSVPMSQRITASSMVNIQPQALLDDKVDLPEEASSFGLGSAPGILGNYVRAAREWYVYRKSGTGAGNAAATVSTLYYDTRRLTADLSKLDTTGGTQSLQMDKVTGTSSTIMDTSNFKVFVGTTQAGSVGGTDVTKRVDVDPIRGRVYFPSYMEGLWSTITYIRQDGTTKTVSTTSPLEWQDEPYVNAQNPATIGLGERTVPILTPANESNPCLFMDPTAGAAPAIGAKTPIIPHRMWLFWASDRNAASSGSDIFYESLDPKFNPAIP